MVHPCVFMQIAAVKSSGKPDHPCEEARLRVRSDMFLLFFFLVLQSRIGPSHITRVANSTRGRRATTGLTVVRAQEDPTLFVSNREVTFSYSLLWAALSACCSLKGGMWCPGPRQSAVTQPPDTQAPVWFSSIMCNRGWGGVQKTNV